MGLYPLGVSNCLRISVDILKQKIFVFFQKYIVPFCENGLSRFRESLGVLKGFLRGPVCGSAG